MISIVEELEERFSRRHSVLVDNVPKLASNIIVGTGICIRPQGRGQRPTDTLADELVDRHLQNLDVITGNSAKTARYGSQLQFADRRDNVGNGLNIHWDITTKGEFFPADLQVSSIARSGDRGQLPGSALPAPGSSSSLTHADGSSLIRTGDSRCWRT